MSEGAVNRKRTELGGKGSKGFAMDLRCRLFVQVAAVSKQLEMRFCPGTRRDERNAGLGVIGLGAFLHGRNYGGRRQEA